MLKVVVCGLSLFLGVALHAQSSLGMDVANLTEDVRGLKQKLNELQLRVEQLERENADLKGRAVDSYATVAQLNEAVAEVNRSIKSSAATTKSETLQQVSGQMEKLANQTNAAIESLANGINARNASAPRAAQTTFSDNYPKEGINYTVQKGDTLAVIARKTGAKQQDIVNANKIADPTKIQPGQSLFIPGGKQ